MLFKVHFNIHIPYDFSKHTNILYNNYCECVFYYLLVFSVLLVLNLIFNGKISDAKIIKC